MNFCRSLAAKPSALPLRSRLQEQLGAVIVFPLAGVHRAAPQPDDHGQVLDPHRALEFAAAAGGALKRGLFGDVPAQQRRFAGRLRIRFR